MGYFLSCAYRKANRHNRRGGGAGEVVKEIKLHLERRDDAIYGVLASSMEQYAAKGEGVPIRKGHSTLGVIPQQVDATIG